MFQMNLIKKLKTSYSIRLSSDNRFLCHNMGRKTIVYDFTSWEKIIELDKPNNPSNLRFSKNNEYLLIKNTVGTICVYDTVDFSLVRTFQSNKSFKLIEGDVNFTQDNSILDVLHTSYGRQIALIDIHTKEHKILTDFEDSYPSTGCPTMIFYNQFIQSENSHLFTLSYVDETDYRVHKIVKVKEPINKDSSEVLSNSEIWYWDSVIFDSTYQVFILVQDYEIILMDSDFKKVLKKKHIVTNDYLDDEIGYLRYFHLSNDSKFIVVTYSSKLFILRYDDLTTILVENIPYACFAEFSNDNRHLLVGTWNNGYVLENNLK
ncbi:hypothetical protein L1N85_19810 [Paenibacillus alkaliterrae]|uniref:hypothetical protein n=1 Tax=Paenibacillus alkaliterrae TaxID=320909 RepID=UPI001F334B8A|nr:hypothetical protein [Paenibacillus alkaliterrae]MCF2940641.1 hypothetical protein [Paenibacillus alkaliterrae]